MAIKTRAAANDANGRVIEPDTTYICLGFMALLPSGFEGVWPKGTRLRGDHEAVQAQPQQWHRDGDPDPIPEIPAADELLRPERAAEGDALTAKHAVVLTVDGARYGIDAGQWVAKKHPAVKAYPEHFEPIRR